MPSPSPHCKLLFKMLSISLLRRLHLSSSCPTKELRQGGRLQSGRGKRFSLSLSATYLNELVLPDTPPPFTHTRRYRNLADSPPLPSRGATAAITETVAAADARFFAPISWVVYRIDVFFFFFSLPPQVVTLGKNSRGYHYILANLVSNNGSCSPESERDRFYPACWKGGDLVSAILPMHNKWIIGLCMQTIGPSVFLFTLASLRLPLVPRQQSHSAAYLPLNEHAGANE